MASMVPAELIIQPPGVGMISFAYNPDEYTVSKDSSWKAHPQPTASEGGTKQFQGTGPSTMEVKILLDQFGIPPLPIEINVTMLNEALKPNPLNVIAGKAAPPLVTFMWGTNVIMDMAVITKVSVTYKRFLLGQPVLAEARVTLEKVESPLPGTNPTSGGVAAKRTHSVVEGDSLASVAYAEFKDPTMWRALAVVNGIDDPMVLRPGETLTIPDPAEARDLS
jgi:nucleoid-associated protein YgaU